MSGVNYLIGLADLSECFIQEPLHLGMEEHLWLFDEEDGPLLSAFLKSLQDRQNYGVLEALAKLSRADGEVPVPHLKVKGLVEVERVKRREEQIKLRSEEHTSELQSRQY